MKKPAADAVAAMPAVVSCKVWLNKKRTTMGNAHPEITVPGRANYLVIAYK